MDIHKAVLKLEPLIISLSELAVYMKKVKRLIGHDQTITNHSTIKLIYWAMLIM